MSDEELEYGYTEWRCTNCGHGVPKNNPPCDRCGNMEFEQVEVHESDFDAEIQGASNRELLRQNALSVGGGVAILLVVALAVLANAGVFVLSDPVGLGYRYGAVDPVTPNDDGTLTAAEFHGQLAAEFDDTSLRWSGRGLELAFRSDATSNAELAEDIMVAARGYATYVDDGGDAATLQITVEVPDGRARVTVDRADAAAFAAGDISESTYQSRVFAGS
ncbi:hypothetical protein [Halorarius litoreus]|uniref:hypothetical protein n=1 Tax=Halorarius litoreus TaxID=2962676 RepID=UPI0020CC59CE|nr:hypothetical protein [Halorarius litoreus]